MPLPFMHNAAMICFLLPALLCGAEMAISRSLDGVHVAETISSRRPTWLVVAGGMLDRLRALKDAGIFDSGVVRGVFSTNAARQTEQALDVTGVHLFGMTEGIIIFGRPEDPQAARYATVGRPISPADEVKLLHPGTEDEVAPGETGELAIRGPYTFHGYYASPERNQEVFTSDGYYRSGDLMSARTIEGLTYYAFEGRLKDVVNRGGETINCEEVEMVIRRHPDVLDVAIVPMPDPVMGERACAFAIVRPGRDALTVGDLREFLISIGIAKYKCPEHIESVDGFPITTAGKLDKPRLKAIIVEKLAIAQAPE